MIRPAELIERKRDGGELTPGELNELMLGYARGDVPDYQMAALCMAIFFRGLNSAENGERALRRHFTDVELRDASGTVEIESRDAVVRYLGSTEQWRSLAEHVPDSLDVPFTARRSNVVFVAGR